MSNDSLRSYSATRAATVPPCVTFLATGIIVGAWNSTGLLRKGETGVIKGFLSAKTGKKYDAALKVEEGRVVPVFQ